MKTFFVWLVGATVAYAMTCVGYDHLHWQFWAAVCPSLAATVYFTRNL